MTDDTILLYTSTNCPICKQLKKKLETDGVKFTEKNVDEDPDAMFDLLMIGLCTVPVLIVNGKVQETEEGSPTIFSTILRKP